MQEKLHAKSFATLFGNDDRIRLVLTQYNFIRIFNALDLRKSGHLFTVRIGI